MEYTLYVPQQEISAVLIDGDFYEKGKFTFLEHSSEKLYRLVNGEYKEAGSYTTDRNWVSKEMEVTPGTRTDRACIEFWVNFKPVKFYLIPGIRRPNLWDKEYILELLLAAYPDYKHTTDRNEIDAFRYLSPMGYDKRWVDDDRERFYKYGAIEKVYQYSASGHCIWGLPDREHLLNAVPFDAEYKDGRERAFNAWQINSVHSKMLTDSQKVDHLIKSINKQ